MSSQFPLLFSPLKLRNVTLKNRIVSTSHDAHFGVGGTPGDRYIRYHVDKAKGGAALIQAFGTTSPHPLSTSGAGNINVWDDSVIQPFRDLSDQIHRYDALITCQLVQRGRRATGLISHVPPVGPSDLPNERTGEVPRVMSVADIKVAIEAYAAAAERTVRGGFDGVELALYGDMLPDQFLSPAVNDRTDQYGGSFDNRLRFSVELLQAVREALGRHPLLIARVSGDDFLPGELSLDERLEVARRFDSLGVVDLFSVLGGTVKSLAGRARSVPSSYFPHKAYLSLARAYKGAVETPVLYATRIVHPSEAEETLTEGAADLVGMTRAIIADPEMPNKAQDGRLDDIRVCVGANACIGRLYQGLPIECVQNPVIGREAEFAEITRTDVARRVVVVGGGPAGLEAARMAALRGHDTVLLERSDVLGGQILTASLAPGRAEFAQVAEWLTRQVVKLGVHVEYGVNASADDILTRGPDVVVVATGSRPRRPLGAVAEGAEVWFAQDVLQGGASLGERVLVISEDPSKMGPTTADFLASMGHKVTVVAPHYTIADAVDDTTKPILLQRLMEQDVDLLPLHHVVEVKRGAVVTENALTGRRGTLETDSVVAACGRHAVGDVYTSLEGRVADLQLIGDALAPRGVHEALLDGARAAIRI